MNGLTRKQPSGGVRCPVGGNVGKRVLSLTVKNLVRNDSDDVEGSDWFFCNQPDCDVVYFANDGRTISKDALKVRVGVKEKNPPRLVCYCFGHTVESIREEIERTGKSTVMASVSAKVQSGDCSCELLNPEGTCCLGEMNRAVKKAFVAVQSEPQDTRTQSEEEDKCCTAPSGTAATR